MNKPRVAIACPGVGLVQRGYERMFHDLFHVMEGEVDATLFKGAGAVNGREKVPLFLPRNGTFLRSLPIHALVGRTAIHAECMTFALGMLPHLREGRFDVVHCVDPPLVRILYKLRHLLGMRFALLYTHGCTMPPEAYPPADHLQQVSRETYDEARKAGIPANAMTLVPVGIHPQRFQSAKGREELRREYGVPDDTFVILSVAAIDRLQKRTDYLVDEVARLEGNYLLWLDGSFDQGDRGLVEYARSRLGERVRVSHVPTARVADLYGAADVMAHASLFEAFGLSLVEAGSTGLPVLCHNAPHFQWLLPNREAWLDMTVRGGLTERLAFLMAHREALPGLACRDGVQRFAWDALRGAYTDMYRHVATLPQAGAGAARRNYFRELHG